MIPDEAVEAAVERVVRVTDGELIGGAADEMVRQILEAAAPSIRAQALRDAAAALETCPPMLRSQYVLTLRLYATSPWRLDGSIEQQGGQ